MSYLGGKIGGETPVVRLCVSNWGHKYLLSTQVGGFCFSTSTRKRINLLISQPFFEKVMPEITENTLTMQNDAGFFPND